LVDEINDQFAAVPSNAADLSIAYEGTTDTLEIYKNGTLINAETVTGNLPDPPFELELAYSNTSPLQGAEIAYEIYIDGRTTPHTSGTFLIVMASAMKRSAFGGSILLTMPLTIPT